MKRTVTKMAMLVPVLLLVFIMACAPLPEEITPAPKPTPTPTPAGEKGNFRLLISDEVNAIGDFQHLHVTISSIGVQQDGESGKWHEFDLDPGADLDGDGIPGIDLTELQGDNAIQIWSGNLTAGEYNKVFIYVDNVTGILGDNVTGMVKLPSGKLQISKPFTISDSIVNFVYDITVVKAGKSGTYILKPQIAQSGANQKFNEITATGKPEVTGKPEDKGKPEGKGKPEAEEAEEQEFEGTIEAITGDNWTMTINGETRTVDVSEAEIEGEPAVGLKAEVEGTIVDSTIVASEVEIKEAERK